MCICQCVCMPGCACTETRRKCQESCSTDICSVLLRQGLSANLELRWWTVSPSNSSVPAPSTGITGASCCLLGSELGNHSYPSSHLYRTISGIVCWLEKVRDSAHSRRGDHTKELWWLILIDNVVWVTNTKVGRAHFEMRERPFPARIKFREKTSPQYQQRHSIGWVCRWNKRRKRRNHGSRTPSLHPDCHRWSCSEWPQCPCHEWTHKPK